MASLLPHESTSHATTQETPSELFLKSKLRTTFDLIKLNPHSRLFLNKEHSNLLLTEKIKLHITGWI